MQQNFNLKNYNTFHFDVNTALFEEFASDKEIKEILRKPENMAFPFYILGGGSNILFTSDFHGLILHNKIKGIEHQKLFPEGKEVLVKAGGGELWHNLVMYCVDRNLGGLENLSLIPGTVGAAPIQNIGAYGVELKDVFYSLEAFNIETGEVETFFYEDCNFGYRTSIFKTNYKGKYIITKVLLKLTENPDTFNISYGAIQSTLDELGYKELSVKAVSEAVIHIRKSKLPDPAEIGNAGSFFKNPEIEVSHYERIKEIYQDMPSYPSSGGKIKVPAGWLIEQCGWKGKKVGSVGVHKNQALVLVHYGGGKGSEILKLSQDIRDSVFEKFQIELEPEVNII